MIELTPVQRLGLNDDPPRVLDPETRTRYVLVREDVYERLEALLVPDRLLASEQQAAVLRATALRAGWDDPEMDVHDREASEQRP